MSKEVNSNKEKVVTKYDLKMQRREEEKKQAKKDELVGKIIGVLVVLGLLALVLSFPIRSHLTVNGTYAKVNDTSISKVEFDYYYNSTKNAYLTQYGTYLSYMGYDLSGDLSKIMMPSGNFTWDEYFMQTAMNQASINMALVDEAKKNGFDIDVTKEYEEYVSELKEAAKEAGVSESAYIKDLFGSYATLSRIKGCIEKELIATKYYSSVEKTKLPTEAEVKAHYEANKDEYDSVDYRFISVTAELPKEPTELANTTETDDKEATAEGEEKAYEPSEAEIAAAMALAKAEADEKAKTIATDGELRENMKIYYLSGYYSEWLSDPERKPGDVTVIENETGHVYYVLEFEKRYLDETTTSDVRIIVLNQEEGDGKDIVDEWKNGAATEESFAELADKYNKIISAEGGFFEKQAAADMSDTNMALWLKDKSRKKGDVEAFSGSDGYTYVVYYVADNVAEWYSNIEKTLLTNTMNDYVQEISKNYEVKDPKGNLSYLSKISSSESSAE